MRCFGLALPCLALCLTVTLAQAEISQKGDLRVAFEGEMRPHRLPRAGTAPISVAIGGQVTTTDGTQPPTLSRFRIALNRNGHLFPGSLPPCKLSQIQPATSRNALAACRSSLVGEGSFSAAVAIPEQSPFPSRGKLLAFNGTQKGRPVIFAHIYGTQPIPTSFTLPLRISKTKGTYGTTVTGSLPEVSSNIAFVTEISLELGRSYRRKAGSRGYLESGCPAPKGFPGVTFALAKATFDFADGRSLTSVLNRSCIARG